MPASHFFKSKLLACYCFGVMVALYCQGCDNVFHSGEKYEIARRTQCKGNMLKLAAAIQAFNEQTGAWPTNLIQIDGGLNMTCPSRNVLQKDSNIHSDYVWNSTNRQLTEAATNHNARQLRASKLRPWKGSVSFGESGAYFFTNVAGKSR